MTACDLARKMCTSPGSLAGLLRSMERHAQVIAVREWRPRQGRTVSLWHAAPPGTVPPPRAPLPPGRLAARRRRDRDAKRAERARHREQLHPVPRPLDLPPGAACAGEDPELFFPATPEDEAKAKAVCAHCPIRRECYAAALASHQESGIWGGVNFEDHDHAGKHEASMTTLISYQSSGGEQGRCDAKCYNAWGPECHCICGGGNHGIGRQAAIDNTRELAQSWVEQARANGQDVAVVEFALETAHEPLFGLGGAR